MAANPERARPSGVQSLERAFDLLEHLADAGGEATLSELTDASGLPMPTIYRLVRTLTNQGYVRQQASRSYALGPRLIRLGETASRLVGSWARPHLARLVDEIGETSNMAMLDGDEIVYLAQVPSKHSMRTFTEVGRRVLPHSTAVGKVLLAQLPATAVTDLLHRTGMPAHTEHTITDAAVLLGQLDAIRDQGYAVDDGEQELGVRCIAVAVPGAPTGTAVSVSGPAARLSEERYGTIVPALAGIATELSAALS